MKFLDRLQPLALLALRAVLGIIMLAHGWPKAFGGAFARHSQTVAGIGFPGWMAYVSTGAEVIGGALLIAGLLTRFAGLVICIEMLVATFKVNWHGGLKGPDGYELSLALATTAFVAAAFGAGAISVDRILWGKKA